MPKLSDFEFKNEPAPWSRDDFLMHLTLSRAAGIPCFGASQTDFAALLNSASACERDSLPEHLTTSSIVLHPKAEKVLLVYHRKYQEWVYPGGHPDSDWFWLRSALRECREETGLESVEVIVPNSFTHTSTTPVAVKTISGKSLSQDVFYPHFMAVFPVAAQPHAHPPMPAHRHFDLVYLFRALSEDIRHEPSESDGCQWVPLAALREQLSQGREWNNGIHILTAELALRGASLAAVDAPK